MQKNFFEIPQIADDFLLNFINGKIKCPLLGEEESLDREEKIKRKT